MIVKTFLIAALIVLILWMSIKLTKPQKMLILKGIALLTSIALVAALLANVVYHTTQGSIL